MRLGEQLVANGSLSEAALATAVEEQSQRRDRLGELLLKLRLINPRQLYEALAVQAGLPFADLRSHPPQRELLDAWQIPDYMRLQALPWRRDAAGVTIACAEPTSDLSDWAHAQYGQGVRFVIATPRDMLHAIEHTLGSSVAAQAREQLATSLPHASARQLVMPKQRLCLVVAALLMLAAIAMFPKPATAGLILLTNALYFLTIAYRFWLLRAGYAPLLPTEPFMGDALPAYSILVPMHGEAAVVAPLLAALEAIDYPTSRLQILLVLEEDDKNTIDAVMAAKPAPHIAILRVPPSQPRTKPKACAYALPFVTGEFTVIYDAEDLPEPLQLRRALTQFYEHGERLACVQAQLGWFNRVENGLTRCFAIEYATLFGWVLPGMARLGLPIPLGGTSNHLRTAALREAGGWDPYNVTEDADLGIRLARNGYTTTVIASLTREEAPITIPAWLKQRARWIKGYLQTWLVLMRDPRRLRRELGWRGFVSVQLFIGAPSLVFFIAPFFWGLSALLWFGAPLPLNTGLQLACLAVLLLGLGLLWFQALVTVRRARWPHMAVAVLAYPVYALLHSLASFKAVAQLITAPHRWDKTAHGKSRMRAGSH